MDKDIIIKLKEYIDKAKKIVCFGGAGVSTESKIPDFRSVDGLYNQKYALPPETIISHHYFMSHTKEFYDFYRDKMLYLDAKPNPAHYFLAKLEAQGKLTAVVTQNIDGLHQKAGSKVVYELHGSVLRNHCTRCGKSYTVEDVKYAFGVPKCTCGGIIKPDVVLYEEPLDNDTWYKAIKAISSADLLIVGGTSLVVYPAASLLDYYSDGPIVLINKSSTSADRRANLVINEKIGEVFSDLDKLY